MFCTECVQSAREACLQALHVLPHHDWRGILYQHDNVLWLAPELHMFQCSSVTAIAAYFNAVDTNRPDLARVALRSVRNISILIDMPGVCAVPIDRIPQLPPVRSPEA